MAGHDRVDWSKAPDEARAWAIDSEGKAQWLHWDVESNHYDDQGWVQPGRSQQIPSPATPAETFDWDTSTDWRNSLTFRP